MNCHLNLIGAGLRLPHLGRNGQYKEIARGIYRKEDEGALISPATSASARSA
jgi:hypothetical protein